MAATLGAAFAASVRMIDWIHGRAAHMGPAAKPATPARFAPHDRAVVRIARRANRRPTSRWNPANLAARQRNLGPARLACHQRGTGAGAAAQCTAAPGLQPDVVNRQPQWDLRQWQTVADSRRRFVATNDHVASLQAVRSDDISLFAVHIMQ